MSVVIGSFVGLPKFVRADSGGREGAHGEQGGQEGRGHEQGNSCGFANLYIHVLKISFDRPGGKVGATRARCSLEPGYRCSRSRLGRDSFGNEGSGFWALAGGGASCALFTGLARCA